MGRYMSGQEKIRLTLVEKHALTRGAFRALVDNWPDIEVVAEAASGRDALRLIAETGTDVVLLDLGLSKDGSEALELLSDLRKESQPARVIVLADGEDISSRVRAVVMGAVGVVLRDQTVGTLKKAIEKVHAGEVWLERTLTADVLRELAGQPRASEPDPSLAKINSLSERERETVGCVCQGLSNREIGERLAISEATVRHHLTSIYNKLGLQNRLELVIFAYHNNLNIPNRQVLLNGQDANN